jgi:hypothetical protein
VSVLLGNGDGSFQSAVNFGAGFHPFSVAVADVNGDGRPDLAATYSNGFDNHVGVLLGNRNAATHLQVSAPAGATAGMPFTITVTARTAGNQLDALYTGTVHFTSSDGMAGLPADYTFTLRDAGSHKFTVTLNTTGSQTITATDTVTSSITGSAVVDVTAAAPVPQPPRGSRRESSPAIAARPANPFRSTITPPDAVGTVTAGYAGPLAFRSPEGTAALPGNDPFLSADEDRHHFSVTGNPTATPRRTATDPVSGTIQGTATVTVNTGGQAGRGPDPLTLDGDGPSLAGVDAFFAQDAAERRGSRGRAP